MVGSATALFVLAATFTWHWMLQPEVTPAIRGMETARNLGCFACHGPEATGGVSNINDSGSAMPGWDHGTAAMYIKSEQEIREWILYGAPLGQATSAGVSSSKSLVPMPDYNGLLSDRELDDLVAYFLAVSGWAPDIPDDAFEGRKIALQLGCFGCHGPSGMGGVPNPGSFKGQIPPWEGEAFGELVENDEELRAWILDGRIRRLWNNPAARLFLISQKIQMPAYREHMSEDQETKVVAYVKWLRKMSR